MHYYQHNIGDYRRDTSHLSLLEHGIYRQLLDWYYLNEQPIPSDDAKLMRSLCVRTADEMQALKNILQDFFVLTDLGYIQKRCDVEIEAFRAKSSNASDSAKARWDKARANSNANALPPQSKGNANQEPKTINQKPKKEKAKEVLLVEIPDFLSRESWESWVQHRIEIKSEMTNSIAKACIKQLSNWYHKGLDPEQAILTSIAGGWTGLFEPKQTRNNGPPYPPQKSKALIAIEKLQGMNNGLAQNGNQHRVIEADIARIGMGSGDGFDRGNFGGMDGSIDP